MPEFDDFDEMVSKIAANESLEDGRVEYYGRIGIGDAARLAEAFQTNSTVTYLLLDGNGLGDEGISLLAGGLLEISTLTQLILSDNNIGDKGAEKLAGVLHSSSSSLTFLVLNYNNIGDKGAEALAVLLHSSSSSLTVLTLNNNSIGEKGARALANTLPFNSSLARLSLIGNSIGPGGATAVAEGLLDNSSVTYLYLGGNGIGDCGKKALALSLLRGNSNLSHIELGGTCYIGLGEDSGINQEMERMLSELLEINSDTGWNPREVLERKIRWLEELEEDDIRLLGLDRGAVEEEQRNIRIETEIGWKLNSEDGAEYEAAVSQALREMRSNFPLAVHRRRLFGRLLGSPKHGVCVASSVGEVGGRALYRKASECGAAVEVLMKLLRAHPSLCGCRDVKHRLYPFALLAIMPAAEVSDVMEALVLNPSLVVKSGIFSPKNDERKRRKVVR